MHMHAGYVKRVVKMTDEKMCSCTNELVKEGYLNKPNSKGIDNLSYHRQPKLTVCVNGRTARFIHIYRLCMGTTGSGDL